MALREYLTPGRTMLLRATTKDEVFREMVSVLRRDDPSVDLDAVIQALNERERLLSSRIAPRIALPHAVLPGYGKPLVAFGYSAAGVPWESPGGDPVNLVILSVCGRQHGNEHIAMLADIGNALRSPTVLEQIARGTSAREIFDVLKGPRGEAPGPLDVQTVHISRQMMHHAQCLAQDVNAGVLMVMADEPLALGVLEEYGGGTPLLLVSSQERASGPEAVGSARFLAVPGYGLRRPDRVKLAFLFALSEGLIGKGDTVVCLSGESEAGRIDVLEVVDIAREFGVLLSLQFELVSGSISSHVFHRVLEVAAALAREGREGAPVGTTFILGDYAHVQKHCYQLVINPVRGYPENERNVLDPGLEETIKEFSRIDGACLIRGDGVIMAFGAYIQAEDAAPALQSGLGARHAAAMAITVSTEAVSVVISESTQRISIFRRGRLVAALDRAAR